MTRTEIFENRREVGKKICQQIRKDNGQMIKAKFFSERPYCDGKKQYKLSTANYLRLMSAENEIIRNCDPRWIMEDEIQNNSWTLKENAKAELLEVWEESADEGQECSLRKFYNASDVLEKEKLPVENQSLEDFIEFLQKCGRFIEDNGIISFHDCINAVKKYAEENGADGLTKIFTVQMVVVESRLKTKIEKYLPIYPERILADIEENPDKIFEAASTAQKILKKLRHEKIKPTDKNFSNEENFGNLKIIYHGSECELKNKYGSIYPSESILTGESAYEFLAALKSAEKQKIWLEFFYLDYSHEKFLISEEDFELLAEETVTDFLKVRLDKNRQQILKNPQELRKYISPNVMVRTEDILDQINLESEIFQSAMKNFAQEELKYLENHQDSIQ